MTIKVKRRHTKRIRHMVREISGGVVTTKCGKTTKDIKETTIWGSRVRCPECK